MRNIIFLSIGMMIQFLCSLPLTAKPVMTKQTKVIGFYTHGQLQDPVELPKQGHGYVVLRPHFHRNYGHGSLVQFIEQLAQNSCALWNQSSPERRKGKRVKTACAQLGLAIGDLSPKTGGLVPPFEHRSHQTGLDVDIGYEPVLIGKFYREHKKAWHSILHPTLAQVGNRFTQKQISLLALAAHVPQVQRIFVHPYIKQALCQSNTFPRKLLRKIQPWYWHDEHFHVRLQCPLDQKATCVPQAPPGQGDGCDQEQLARFSKPWPPPSRQLALSFHANLRQQKVMHSQKIRG